MLASVAFLKCKSGLSCELIAEYTRPIEDAASSIAGTATSDFVFDDFVTCFFTFSSSLSESDSSSSEAEEWS